MILFYIIQNWPNKNPSSKHKQSSKNCMIGKIQEWFSICWTSTFTFAISYLLVLIWIWTFTSTCAVFISTNAISTFTTAKVGLCFLVRNELKCYFANSFKEWTQTFQTPMKMEAIVIIRIHIGNFQIAMGFSLLRP